MNERIKLLAQQAKLPEYVLEYGTELCLAPHLEKFAELIVRECADIAKQTEPDDGNDYKSGRSWAGIEILKHFNVGVEE